MRRLLSVIAALISASTLAYADCPYPGENNLLSARQWIDLAVVRIVVNGPGECTTTGTGFFVGSSGEVMTAAHVVPKQCDSISSIKVYWNEEPGGAQLSGGIEAAVVGRSSLDAALLRLKNDAGDGGPSSRQYLMLENQQSDDSKYRNRCVLLASHYFEQYDVLTSFAEISSVALVGNSSRWALSGPGFNPSRSGSPLLLSNGRVVGIFVEKAGDSSDRNQVIENRAYILPISKIPDTEIDVSAIRSQQAKGVGGLLEPFLTLHIPMSEGGLDPFEARALKPINIAFGLSITEEGFRTDPSLPTFVSRQGKLMRVSSLTEAVAQTIIGGGSVLRQVPVTRRYKADPGRVFNPETFAIEVASLNPPEAASELPRQRCGEAQTNCFAILEGGTVLELRMNLYPGLDGRRSWIDGEVRIAQIPNG